MENFEFPSKWMFSLVIIILTFIFGFIFSRLYWRLIRKSANLLQNDPTNYKFLGHILTAVIYVLGFSWAIYALPNLRNLADTLLASAGILAVAVGFASQQALSNIIGGVFIVVFKPFRINDLLKLQSGLQGTVEDITLRHTVIRDFENRRIIIPNSIISNEVITNADMGDARVCRFIEIGISYGSDIDTAKHIIRRSILSHPLHIDPRTQEQLDKGNELAPVRVIALQDSGILLRGYAWAEDAGHAFLMGTELNQIIKEAFDREGIEIPFPHRKVVFEKPEESGSIEEFMGE